MQSTELALVPIQRELTRTWAPSSKGVGAFRASSGKKNRRNHEKRTPKTRGKKSGRRRISGVNPLMSDAIRAEMLINHPQAKAKLAAFAKLSSDREKVLARLKESTMWKHPETGASIYSSAKAHRRNQMNALQPFKMMRTINQAALTDAVGGTETAANFQLDQIPSFAEMTALFDQYRFTKITVQVFPNCNVMSLTTQAVVTTQYIAPLVITFDPDDSTVPANIDEVLAYPTAKSYPGTEPFQYSFKPRAAIAAYGGAFTQFADFDGWLDCAFDDIEYYGFKAATGGAGGAQTAFQVWFFRIQIEMEFRFVH